MSELHREKKTHTLFEYALSYTPDKARNLQWSVAAIVPNIYKVSHKWLRGRPFLDRKSIFHTSLQVIQGSDIGICITALNTLAQCKSTCCKHTTIVSWFCELCASPNWRRTRLRLPCFGLQLPSNSTFVLDPAEMLTVSLLSIIVLHPSLSCQVGQLLSY